MERISTHQFMTLGAAVLMGGTFLLIPSYVTEVGGRDGWMAILPAFALTIPYGLMLLSLSAQYPQKNLLQISEKLFGKWIGKIIGFIYILTMELSFVQRYLILPFASVWIPTLWGVSRWKKGANKINWVR